VSIRSRKSSAGLRRSCRIGILRTAGYAANTRPADGSTVGHLAEAAWHHPDLTVSYAFVIVKLITHTAKGVTDKDFALAKKIEEVIQWQPGSEGGALEGTPNDDVRFKYLKYDQGVDAP